MALKTESVGLRSEASTADDRDWLKFVGGSRTSGKTLELLLLHSPSRTCVSVILWIVSARNLYIPWWGVEYWVKPIFTL